MTMRRVMLTIHLWAGLAAAVFLFALGVSGSLVAFENEIDRALNPKLTWIQPGTARLSLAQMTTKLEHAYPGYKVAGVEFAQRDDVAWGAGLSAKTTQDGLSLAFSPYTGAILGNDAERNDFTGKVHQFHLRLLAGKTGANVVTSVAVLLLGQAISGLVLWWPKKIVTVNWRRPFRSMNLELHQALGLYTSALLLVFSMTALIIHWDSETQTLVNRVTGSAGVPPFPRSRPLEARQAPPDFDAILAVAQNAEPDARPTFIQMDGDPVRIAMKGPGDHTPAGRTNLFIDAYTRNIVWMIDWRTAPLSFRVVKLWNREIHTGDIGGLPTRILACAISLSLPVLAVTGPLIWWQRRRRSLAAKVDEYEAGTK
jgi:uncharacterized iron-regulated membrane protein